MPLTEPVGVYWPRHPERTVAYRLFEEHFERYVREYGELDSLTSMSSDPVSSSTPRVGESLRSRSQSRVLHGGGFLKILRGFMRRSPAVAEEYPAIHRRASLRPRVRAPGARGPVDAPPEK